MSNSELFDPEKDDNKPAEAGKKKKRSVQSMLKQMEMSSEEIKYRMENFDNVDIGKEYVKNLKCTKCNMNFQKIINRGESVGVHPLLGVLMCDSCCDYYGDGNFSLDSEGEDKYCRWCGEGGTIFACSQCICGFCDSCIEKHFGADGLEGVKNDDDWVCYFCNNKPLWYLRSICFLANEAAKNKHEQLKKKKESRNVKRKRRKKEKLEGINSSDNSSSGSSSNSSKSPTKRKRPLRRKEEIKRDESSSSEDEKENHVSSTRKLKKSKKHKADHETFSENDVKNPGKKSKMSCDKSEEVEVDEGKKAAILEKLTSIWKLTQTVTEVGLNSSHERLRVLSKPSRFETLHDLKKEHEKLKSCMNALVSSLNIASNSVASIKDDLTFDNAKDEREIFQIQEIKLKRFGKKCQEESSIETSNDSDGGDSVQNGLETEDSKKMRPDSGEEMSTRDSKKVKRKNRESDVSSKKKSKGGKNKSVSLFSESRSEEQIEKRNSESDVEKKRDENVENRDSEKISEPVRPLLKVKSFAKMLHDNVYDKRDAFGSKNENDPVVIDLYNTDTDEGETDNQCMRDSTQNESTRISDAEINKSCESVREAENEENPINNNAKENEPVSEREGNDERESSDENDKVENTKSDSSDEIKKRKKKKKKRRKKISSDAESDKTAGLSEDESGVEKESSSGTKNEKKPVDENIDRIDSSDQKSDNTSDEGDTEEKKKKKRKGSHSSEGENSADDKSADSEGSEGDEKEKKQNCSDDESEKKKNTSTHDSISADKEEPSESEQEEDAASVNKNSQKQDSSDSESKNSSNAEQKRTRSSRSKKAKDAFRTSFMEYKRKRERFLNSKEKGKTSGDTDENKTMKVLESSESESEQKKNVQKVKKLRKKRVLASSDEEDWKELTDIKSSDVEKSEEEEEKDQNRKSDSNSPSEQSSDKTSSDDKGNRKKGRKVTKRKKTIVNSDSSEDEKSKKSRKKKKEHSSESSGNEDKGKRKGRKNIQKILKKDSLQVETKQALINEEERKKRVKERQKLFEELFPPEKEDKSPKQIILDFDPETKEPLVKVHKKLAKKLKPHQVKGVRFMWNNCFESVQKMEEENGSGCILAHCMGLGKTLQVITLIHTVMTHDLGVNTVLIVCPLSTVSNWIREFEIWLENVNTDPITLYDLVKYKRMDERRYHLEDWHENGGVLVLSYDLFRTLTKHVFAKKTKTKTKKKNAKLLQIFEKVLLDPGPDLVICDEGHLLKNEDTALSKSISRIKTSRRIILTGTPLQNNLIEYHCMVQFVKPNILGTKKEFCNRFVNPINNGQFEDSTELDVKIMKKRSHVLHSMLDGCIQRFDYSVLTPFLPEKHEYVLSISLTETQAKAYMYFIQNLSGKSTGNSRATSLFNDYHNLQRIWTHPRSILMQSEKESLKEALESESEGSLKDFIVSTSDEESGKSGSENSDCMIQEVVPKKRVLRSNANDPETIKAIDEEAKKLREKHWWDEFYDEKAFDDLRESNKLVVLFSLLKYCGEVKDKVLVFSQSLYTLDLIEYFLGKIDENAREDNEMLCGHQDTWVLGSDYFRFDGCTRSESRAIWCKYFNEESNTRARLFLISTRAGGLGINLYGANRVVLFDASWNPSHDLQSIFRVYRFGQKKTCYIYRFLAEATMEEKIYERQVTKLSLAHRVVDEHQIERHYTMGNLQELYTFQPTPKDQREVPKLPKDSVLADLLRQHKDVIVGYHEHDSLLENKQEEELTEEERKAAWKEYEEEKVQKAFNIANAMQQMQFPQAGIGIAMGMGMGMGMGIGMGVNMGVGYPNMPTVAGAGVMNPLYQNQTHTEQNFINPMYLQSNISFDVIQRGMRVGVTPLPNESLESYLMRILNRENWMLTKQPQ